ncbi:hypothetical protein E2542_SST03813 [Spatholobus suberectus]|nr:hypothetical protein E2542_SST03813 [Spatholobus suberectus]
MIEKSPQITHHSLEGNSSIMPVNLDLLSQISRVGTYGLVALDVGTPLRAGCSAFWFCLLAKNVEEESGEKKNTGHVTWKRQGADAEEWGEDLNGHGEEDEGCDNFRVFSLSIRVSPTRL